MRSTIMVVLSVFFSFHAHATKLDFNSICGGTDDRAPSQLPFAARIREKPASLTACSASLIGNTCMVTAAHCADYINVVEFNTPESKNGKLVPTAAEDIYIVDPKSIVAGTSIEGDDYAVFKVLKNEKTEKTPGDAQKGFYRVATSNPVIGSVLRITGYGIDNESTRHQAQQTSMGPLMTVLDKENTIEYQVDTEPGNSGSGVVIDNTQEFIAVHTNGGCSIDKKSANFGTSLALNAKFQEAVSKCLETDGVTF